MRSVKFTPGPWFPGHLGEDSPCQCTFVMSEGYAGGIATIEVENSEKVGSRSVADGFNDAPPKEEAIANMHLTAAGPDMYAALEKVLNSDMAMREEDEGRKSDILEIVRAALARARGER